MALSEGRRCARSHKVKLEEVDETTSKELEAWEKSKKSHIVQVVSVIASIFFFNC